MSLLFDLCAFLFICRILYIALSCCVGKAVRAIITILKNDNVKGDGSHVCIL